GQYREYIEQGTASGGLDKSQCTFVSRIWNGYPYPEGRTNGYGNIGRGNRGGANTKNLGCGTYGNCPVQNRQKTKYGFWDARNGHYNVQKGNKGRHRIFGRIEMSMTEIWSCSFHIRPIYGLTMDYLWTIYGVSMDYPPLNPLQGGECAEMRLRS